MVSILQSDYQPILTPDKGAAELARLQNTVKKHGFLNRSYVCYSLLYISFFSLYFLLLYLTKSSSGYFMLVVLSILFGLLIVQFGGLMHDAAHKSILKSDRANMFLAFLAALPAGLNPQSWLVKHNLHHDHPNQEGLDPDLEVPFSFTQKHYENPTRPMKWMRSFQDLIYFPTCSFLLFHMQIYQNILYTMRTLKSRIDFFSILTLIWCCASLFVWYGIPFLLVDPLRALVFIFVSSSMAGVYAANVFAPNHKAMPQIGKEVVLSNLEQQIITTRNVKPSIINDFIFMGLNYQIEHHLFPNCPRNKYKLIAPYVKSLCEKTGLPYTEETPLSSFKLILQELSQIRKKSQL